MLARSLVTRSLAQLPTTQRTPTGRPLTPVRPPSASLQRIASMSIQQAKQEVKRTDPSALNVLIVNRKKRRLANAEQVLPTPTPDNHLSNPPSPRACLAQTLTLTLTSLSLPVPAALRHSSLRPSSATPSTRTLENVLHLRGSVT